MATGTAGNTGHRLHLGVVHTIAARVLYTDWTGTNNDAHVWGELPPYSIVTDGATNIVTGFDDTTGDDLDIGVSGGDDDLFASGVDVNSAAYTTFDDVAVANQFASTARKLTVNFTTAPTGNGTTGEAYIFIRYVMVPASGSTI